jgi:hypothetical protein
MVMMGHGTVGISALLITSAVGYFVCISADSQKKGSLIRDVGLVLGSLIIIISLLGAAFMLTKKCPFGDKWICKKMMGAGQEQSEPCMPPRR